MDDLHNILHELNDKLINIKTVLQASDKVVTEHFKRHIVLINKTSKHIDEIQQQIDNLFLNKKD